MSPKLFEQFLRVEIARHPSLVTALKRKGGLRHCSMLFEEAMADLHYSLIRRAVQLLFSQANADRLRQLNFGCEGRYYSGGGDRGFSGSSSESKYIGTDSSCTATPASKTNRDCSPISRSSSRISDARPNIQDGNYQWDRQFNNSQSRKLQAPTVSSRHGGPVGANIGNRCTIITTETTNKLPQNPDQWQSNCQQSKQQQQQQPRHLQPSHKAAAPKAPPCTSVAPQRTKPLPITRSPPQHQPTMREGPAYNYPTATRQNRQAMASWYVANMDALLSNLMRLFEKIYVDTLRMCGTSRSALQQLNNALPDPTLMSLQQRAGGAWRPNYMNCKIDFLLHIAAMVYRNTQNLRCGCQCPELNDRCSAWNKEEQVGSTVPVQLHQQQSEKRDYKQSEPITEFNSTANRNNAATAAVLNADELVGWRSSGHQSQRTLRPCCETPTPSEASSYHQAVKVNNRKAQAQHKSRPKSRKVSAKHDSTVYVHRSNGSSSDTIIPAANVKKASTVQLKRNLQRKLLKLPMLSKKKEQSVLTVQRSCVLVASEDAGTSGSDRSI